MSIAPIQPPAVEGVRALETTPRTDRTDLGGAFADALREASALEKSSEAAAAKFAAGDPAIGIHEVMIASEKANVALKFATTLKNKALDAYRELMSTQV
jgi:flagellar hook-basal body complex protein FliE